MDGIDTYLHPILCYFLIVICMTYDLCRNFFFMYNLPCFHHTLKTHVNLMNFFYNPLSLALFQRTQLRAHKSDG
jgi:hypothetical protein